MARLLLNATQFQVLDILAREGGMRFSFLFDRVHAACGASAHETVCAAQDLYDMSFVDVRRTGHGELPPDGHSQAGAGEFVDNLDPLELREAYRRLDAFNAGSYQADTRGVSDPFYFSASSLGLAELLKPEYAERALGQGPRNSGESATGDGLPPPESLPTLPLD